MATAIQSAFERMGARARVAPLRVSGQLGRPWNGRRKTLSRIRAIEPVRIDVLRDELGEYFDLRKRDDVTLRVSDVVSDDRHLVLTAQSTQFGGSDRSAFLCGHDERAWFVAAIPEESQVYTVQDAKDALKPREVWDSIREFGVPLEDRDRRRTAGFVRQGEWFFLPCPAMDVEWSDVVFNEPIRRGGGKPHICEALYREAGVHVFLSEDYPNGLTFDELRQLSQTEQQAKGWERRVRDATVYVRGRVRHSDHATIVLPFWHKVVMNTETKSLAMRQLAFID